MWFKNLTFYRFTRPFQYNAETLSEALQESRFAPCSSQEQSRYGWVSPMGKGFDELVHASGNYLLLCARKEEKILPSSVIKDHLDERVELIEHEQDRKVRKKERDTLKDEILLDLLPKAFSRFQHTYGYIDLDQGLLVVDASSAKRADDFSSFLRKVLGSLPVVLPTLNKAPASVMTSWLQDDSPLGEGFGLGDACELKDPSEDGGKVTCQQQHLHSEEISSHLNAGKQAVKVALNWNDSLSCMIAEDMIVRRIKFSDLLQEKAAEMGSADAAALFDADFTLQAMEISKFIPQLITLMGGENEAANSPAIDA